MPTLTIKRNYDLNFSALPISINSQHYKIKNGGELTVDVPTGTCNVKMKDSFGLKGNTLIEITENSPVKLYLQPRVSHLSFIFFIVLMLYFYILSFFDISNTPWWFIVSTSFPVIYHAICLIYKSDQYYSFSEDNKPRIAYKIAALYVGFSIYLFFTYWVIPEHFFKAYISFIGIIGFFGLFILVTYNLVMHTKK
ncbi:MAG: hypothetical protein GX273_08955 [Bacteroidales bacterium]|nr:hypothetical protein [Bacteroidales bacterium]